MSKIVSEIISYQVWIGYSSKSDGQENIQANYMAYWVIFS